MLWILLSRNASTNTKSFYHNSWKMKFTLPTQGASRAHWTCVNVFFWTEELCRILFLPICTSRIYSVHVNQPAPHPTPPPHPGLPQKWSARQTVEFPTSHISFVTQHVLHVAVTGNVSGQMHVLCIRNFVTYAGLMQTGEWPLLKIRGQWAMRFSDISGHRSIRICIVLPVFVYNWWLQRLRVN